MGMMGRLHSQDRVMPVELGHVESVPLKLTNAPRKQHKHDAFVLEQEMENTVQAVLLSSSVASRPACACG